MITLLAATRPTRRDAIQRPGRSLAAILLVAVPMFLVSFFLTENESRSNASYSPTAPIQAHYSGENAYELLEETLHEGIHAELTVIGITDISHGAKTAHTFVMQSPRAQQVAVPRAVLSELNADIGDTIFIQGIPVQIQALSPSDIMLPEGTLFDPENFSEDDTFFGTWTFSGPREFTEQDAKDLEAVGFEVYGFDTGSSAFTLSAVPGYLMGILSLTILAVVALMLISPVFTIAASRQTRNFALLASQGATPRHIRWAVLVYGAFAGLIGAALGFVLGLISIISWWTYSYPEFPLVVPWITLASFWVMAVLASTAAAFLPAIFASRSSIINGIHGGVSDKIIRWTPLMLIGPIVLILAVVAAFLAGDGEWGDVVKQLCFLVAVLALTPSVPAVLWALGRLPGLIFKLATRDMLRRSMHSVPAIGALAAVIMLGTFIQTTDQAKRISNQEAYASVYSEAVFVRSDTQIPGLMGQKIDVMGSKTLDLYLMDENYHLEQTAPPLTSLFEAKTIIATPEILEMFEITEEADIYAPSSYTPGLREYMTYPDNNTHRIDTVTVLPALYPHFLLSPETFTALGGDEEFLGTIVLPDELDEKTIQKIKQSEDAELSPFRSDNPLPPYGSMLVVVTIVVVALVLMLSNRRRQHATLHAIGAAPRTIRKVNALNAALLALVGGIMGIVSGWIAALFSGTTDEIVDGTILKYGTLEHMMLPWTTLVGLLIVAPLVCAVIGAIASPLERHQEASA